MHFSDFHDSSQDLRRTLSLPLNSPFASCGLNPPPEVFYLQEKWLLFLKHDLIQVEETTGSDLKASKIHP